MASMYKYVAQAWKKPKENLKEIYKERLIEWRREGAITRVAKPTRIDRARSLGYKAKQGFIVLRVCALRGGRKRPKITGGRRTHANSSRKDLDVSYRAVCERRAQDKYKTLEVLNSYYVGRDGMRIWYEVIMVDPAHPQIKADKRINWICNSQNRGRVYRGLTSAGKKSRGLRNKGKGAEKVRPSKTAYHKHKASKQRKVKTI